MQSIKRWSARFQRKKIGIVCRSEPEPDQQLRSEYILEDVYNPPIPICRGCRSIRLWDIGAFNGQDHAQSIATLRSSAENCPSCKLILNAIWDEPEPERPIQLVASDFCKPYSEISISCENHSIGSLDLFAELGSPALVSGDVAYLPPGRPNGLDRISKWIETCQALHSTCTATALKLGTSSDELTYLPTRVINVGPSDGTQEPSLLESNGQRGEYLTLSHCWGNAQILRTNSSRLQEFKRRIPFHALCKNFQDAIVVTRRLGYKYLWIDSLCIIQDSAEDWDRESARMADIYLYSTLTICASVANDGNAGFLHQRVPLDTACVMIPYIDSAGVVAGHYFLSRKLERLSDLSGGALNKRGWTLQENILSRRSVLFGNDQMHWECQTSAWDEGETIFAPYESVERNLLKLSKFINPISPIQKVGSHETASFKPWYQTIWWYCQRQLSVESDKLPAISGLAHLFQRHTGCHYAAGLWEEDLACGLLWSKQSSGRRLKRPTSPRAPTWSWASVDGPIKFPSISSQVINDAQIFDAKFEAEYSGLDHFGKITSATLTLTGRLQPVWLGKREGGRRYDDPVIMDKDGQTVGGVLLDDAEIVDSIYLYGFLVTVQSKRGWYYLESLLLQRTTEQSTFRRLGVFYSDTQPYLHRSSQPTELSIPSLYRKATKENITLV